jgi:signal transduction histidine kinase
METLVTRAREANLRGVDAVVAAALVVIAVVAAAGGTHHGPLPLLAAATTCATVAWRWRAPATMVIVAVAGMAVFAVSSHGVDPTVAPIALLLDYYALGRTGNQRGRPGVDVALLAVPLAATAVGSGGHRVLGMALVALATAVPFGAGRALASRAALSAELQAKARRLEREQQERARRAAAEERNRIARELHDVVAHNVSVMVIQTQAARRVARKDPDAALGALSSVQSCGRDALAEMRRMIGVLRRGDEELAGATAPALSELGTLVARARAAGLPVELRLEGDPRELSPGIDLMAFRIVQEALTNVIKHAGPARAYVIVVFTPDALELDISDTGQGPALTDARADTQPTGHGLVGMRERVRLYGGQLETGQGPNGGFRVHARVPLLDPVTA